MKISFFEVMDALCSGFLGVSAVVTVMTLWPKINFFEFPQSGDDSQLFFTLAVLAMVVCCIRFLRLSQHKPGVV